MFFQQDKLGNVILVSLPCGISSQCNFRGSIFEHMNLMVRLRKVGHDCTSYSFITFVIMFIFHEKEGRILLVLR